jgi:isocitrate dehydrogenase
VLREGNSDRRVARPVKEFAKANPHRMGEWSKDSKSHVSSMKEGDFYGSEQSVTLEKPTKVKIEFQSSDGKKTVLKDFFEIEKGEVIDSAVMSCSKLRDFYRSEIDDAKASGLLLSVHLKATMMKVSDPVLFGHAVEIYFADLFNKYESLFDEIGVNPNNGLGDLLKKISALPADQKNEIEAAIKSSIEKGPNLAMVNSDKGITNLHVPSDVIIDASMPAAIRNSGMMWGPDGELAETKALIPDRSYAGIYDETIRFCKEYGAFDVATMGNVSNVGLMAQKAEEYGSHDKTFELTDEGSVCVLNESGEVLMQQSVSKGDLFRMCQTKNAPIKDWVRLCVKRAQATGLSAYFWLDPERAHDRELIKKVQLYLKDFDLSGLDIQIKSPVEAMRSTLEKVKEGQDVISVTGNVLRDYLTDLFPILELGTSAKMLSIVPLLSGGGLFETGAGGSAPKHVQQLLEENHLRWDSLGEFLALGASLEFLSEQLKNQKAKVLAEALDDANDKFLKTNKSPSRKVGELDTRGSHFYIALYWAEALANQDEDDELKLKFSEAFAELEDCEAQVIDELNSVQGVAVDLDGYYFTSDEITEKIMRPSKTFNRILSKHFPQST